MAVELEQHLVGPGVDQACPAYGSATVVNSGLSSSARHGARTGRGGFRRIYYLIFPYGGFIMCTRRRRKWQDIAGFGPRHAPVESTLSTQHNRP